MCPRCGSLVGSEDDECVECGLRTGTPQHGLASLWKLLNKYGSTTSILVGFIVVVYAGMVILNGGIISDRRSGLLQGLLFGFDPNILLRCGMQYPNYVEHGQSWRLVSAMFLHGGLVHVAFNVYMLLQLGRLCELYFDARRTFILFFLSGLFGFIGSYLFGKTSVGASGAVLGLAGAVMVKARFSSGGIDQMIFASIGRWVVMVLLLSFLPMIDWVGHVFGLVAGGGIGYLLIWEGGVRPRVHLGLFWACVVILLCCLAMAAHFCLYNPPPYYVFR